METCTGFAVFFFNGYTSDIVVAVLGASLGGLLWKFVIFKPGYISDMVVVIILCVPSGGLPWKLVIF